MNFKKNIYHKWQEVGLQEKEDEQEELHDEEFIEFLPVEKEPVDPISQGQDQTYWLSLLALEKTVIFPDIIVPVTLKHKPTAEFVKEAYQAREDLGLIAPSQGKNKRLKGLHAIGTRVKVLKLILLPEGETMAILQGKHRFKLLQVIASKQGLKGEVRYLKESFPSTAQTQTKALIQAIKETTLKILSLLPDPPAEVKTMLENIQDLTFLIYYIATNMGDFSDKQKILSTERVIKRGKVLLKYLLKELQITRFKHKIHHKVQADIDQQHKDFYIRQQIKLLQNELGEGLSEGQDEIDDLVQRSLGKKWSQEVRAHFEKTLERASRTPAQSPERANLINYIHVMLELPWGVCSKDHQDLAKIQRTLDADHYGIEKAKSRVLEFIAVQLLKKDLRGPILCFHGPPGTGKTSLCRSIAKAMGRAYVRMALGGLDDTAELRGHRKTYIGAQLGRVMALIKQAQKANPVFVFDEIDKLDARRGNPAAVMLEIFDPEQNAHFVDNYLEVPFDLSKVFFIATANDRYNIPAPLADRMEFIEVSGYTVEEKTQIAKQYLIPKQRKAHGLRTNQVSISDDALTKLISEYTSESGVRELERKVAGLHRKVAKAKALQEPYDKQITAQQLPVLLGREPFGHTRYQPPNLPGISVGLAWTPVGGEILFIESALAKGEGKLNLSGHLGEVMEESAQAALAFLRVNAQHFKVQEALFKKYDLYVHVPDGATPKDGPSAGIALFSALLSLYTQHQVCPHLAMTGEITLRGKVLPVGGIKEKILAAKRAGIVEILLSKKNQKDVEEVQARYLEGLTFHYLESALEIPPLALEKQRAPNARQWEL